MRGQLRVVDHRSKNWHNICGKEISFVAVELLVLRHALVSKDRRSRCGSSQHDEFGCYFCNVSFSIHLLPGISSLKSAG